MMGEEKTRQVFGEYVSVYNFAQSVQDRATVPLYYEDRIPELQLTNANLNADMEQLLTKPPNWTTSKKSGWNGVRPRVSPDHP